MFKSKFHNRRRRRIAGVLKNPNSAVDLSDAEPRLSYSIRQWSKRYYLWWNERKGKE